MTLRKSTPLKWTPRGASDTLDASNTFNGGMRSLQNLIRDLTTIGLWVCRPAAVQQTAFVGGPAGATFVSWFEVVGDQVYGLVASTVHPGFDEPFCYSFTTGLFVAVTGITGANIPASPASSGDWNPPTSALIGVKLVVTHPGFPGGAGNFFGWFDVSNIAAPTWAAGNTATNPLPTVPIAVFQFYNRAYFASGRFLVFTDVLDPLTVTLATQVLTLGDTQPITALGGLPASNLTGALTQALIVFKSKSNPMTMYQVTGDAAVTGDPLRVNDFKVSTGTQAPMTICATPKGLAFLAPDGLRIIDFSMAISDPINTDGDGIAVPFIYAVTPSRMCAACNGNTMRISTQNNYEPGAPFQEWWLDFKRMQWSGPHTFPASMIKPYRGSFVLAARGVNAKLFTSEPQQSAAGTFVENGTQMSFLFQTPMLPDTDQMSESAVVEMTLDIAFPPGALPYLATVGDQNGTLFSSVFLQGIGDATIWGAFQWGQAPWLGAGNALAPRQMPWPVPIVFRRLYYALNGNCSGNLRIGTLRMRYEQLGYLQQELPVVA